MLRQIRTVLSQLEQPHLIEGVESLSPEEQEVFLQRLQSFSPDLRKKQKALLGSLKKEGSYAPYNRGEKCGNPQDVSKGEKLIAQGKVGCLILAGGQGTRLGFDGPKGAFPILGKSLFQILCEKVKSGGPICIMTSPCNHAQTLDFFKQHNHFSLDPSQISFFQQEMLPFIDDHGDWLLEKPGKIAEGPDGNGRALHLFYENGLWEKWKKTGVEYLNVIFVDNALADPFDPEFVGFTARKGVDAALKAVERLRPDEKMGALAEVDGKLKIIEYFEIPPHSTFTLSSTGMFCIAMPFIEHLCKDLRAEFRLHLNRKSAKVISGLMMLWKGERFIFDLLDYARSSAVLVCPREKIYAPLKNASGEHSPETVEQALSNRD